MLQPVSTAPVHLSAYEEHANPTMLVQMRAMASPMQGLRVVHINATADGGGVAEILRSLVPLLSDLGLDACWYVLPPDGDFFGTVAEAMWKARPVIATPVGAAARRSVRERFLIPPGL